MSYYRYGMTASFRTGEFHGYNVKYSPFKKNLIAVASCQNYGISGKGCLFVLDLRSNRIAIIATRDWKDGFYDVTWSEINPNLIVTSCGDGSIQIWDYINFSQPVGFYKIHLKEVYSVDWNPHNTYSYILSASWDHLVKVWDPFSAKEVACFVEHSDQVYEATWCRNAPEVFVTASADRTLRLWDVRMPTISSAHYVHDNEVLCCDWSKTDKDILAAGTVDGRILEFDARKMQKPLFVLSGHEYAIRQLKFSPFLRGSLVSVSYDFTTRFWNWNTPEALEVHKDHTEFVYGVDCSPLRKNQVCDCSWDSMIHVYNNV